ncbi:hypothetical protein GE09DRAFT_1271930 [Coniochaeta sp. 2T2.1]|nr:hypothetical protein GE09DRAFT_1271930 [Coniochaeta sp. 2T2.1]
MEARADDHASKAKASLASNNAPNALEHAMTAAELYMQAAGKAGTKRDKSRLTLKCKEILSVAEELKRLVANPDPPGPKSTRELTTAEKFIILRSSKIHGKVFAPWEKPPEPSSFTKKDGDELYEDPSEYTLSPTQRDLFAGWKRPLELLSDKASEVQPETLAHDMMTASPDSDLVQDMVTDCSVVASLSAAMSHLCPKADSLLGSLMYPFNHDTFRPALSESGKYVFRMHFNGCFRQVVIDDRLPSSSSNSRTLFVVDRRNEYLIWPALMEKAYLKVRGGYDFPGSNSGTDLYVLTGWIPEQRLLHHEFDIDQTWSAMKRAYEQGNVVATLGTPALGSKEEAELGLVSAHDYAVIDLKEENGERLLHVKNPWRNSVVWKGVASSASVKATDKSTGMFWISFENVVQDFHSLYLNWNPALFTHRQDHHFNWDLPDKTVSSSLSHNPQYTVQSRTSSPIWVLLWRHWQDKELDMLRRGYNDNTHAGPHGLDPAGASIVSDTLGFMGLEAYITSPPGTSILLPDRSPIYHTPLLDSPHTLLRLDDPVPNEPYTIVVAQSDLPLPKYSFSLSFFSLAPLTISPSPHPYRHTQSIPGSWTRRTAGGNTGHLSYYANPAWSLTIRHPTRLSLLLTTSQHNLRIHVALFYSSSPTSSTPPTSAPSLRDMLMSSPEYSRGATHVQSHPSQPVQPGTYIARVSTFTPGHLADFVLAISSDDVELSSTISPLPTPDAGLLRRSLPALVLGSRGTHTHRARLSLSRLTRLSVLARAVTVGPPPCTMKISLQWGGGSSHHPQWSSRSTSPQTDNILTCAPPAQGEGGDEFADVGVGPVRTGEVDVDPRTARERGGLWVVVEGLPGQAGRPVQVDVMSDNEVEVGGWEAVGGIVFG